MFAPRSLPCSLPLRRSAFSLIAGLSLALTACGDAVTAPAVQTPVASVQVLGSTAELTVGDERSYAAELRDANGAQLSGRSVTWTSSDSLVATVSATGRVTAISAGTATIAARAQGRAGSIDIAVQAAPVASIQLSESQVTLNRFDTRLVHAELRDAKGRPVINVVLDWMSEDPSVATVTSSGYVQAVASGETRVFARDGSREAFVTVSVPVSIADVQVIAGAEPVTIGSSAQFRVTAFDDRGRTIDASQAIWSSSNSAVAIVSPTGVVTGVGRGNAVIRASLMNASGFVSIAVRSSDWHFEANLFTPALLVRSDTTTRTEHVLAMTESHLTNARFSYNSVTQAWTFSGEIVHSERTEIQGNNMWRETGRETVADYGVSAGYDIQTGTILMRSTRTNTVPFRFASRQDRAELQGTVMGFPVATAIPLQR